MKLEAFATAAELHTRAATLLAANCAASISLRQEWHCALSGGTTPRGLYELLGSERAPRIDVARAHFWWSDERCVAPDHLDSNYGLAWQSWLGKSGVATESVHRMRGELGAAAGARAYAAELERAAVQLDCVLLGLGEDGHTASLFPGRKEALDGTSLAVAARAPKPPRMRISLGRRTLLAARQHIFLIVGENKADALTRVRAGDRALVASELVREAIILVSPPSLAV